MTRPFTNVCWTELTSILGYLRPPFFSSLKGSIESEEMAQWVGILAMQALRFKFESVAPPYKPDIAVDTCNISMALLSLGLQLLG